MATPAKKTGKRGLRPEAPKAKKKAKKATSKPRQGRLPGIDDNKIERIEALAESYAETRGCRRFRDVEVKPFPFVVVALSLGFRERPKQSQLPYGNAGCAGKPKCTFPHFHRHHLESIS